MLECLRIALKHLGLRMKCAFADVGDQAAGVAGLLSDRAHGVMHRALNFGFHVGVGHGGTPPIWFVGVLVGNVGARTAFRRRGNFPVVAIGVTTATAPGCHDCRGGALSPVRPAPIAANP